MNKIFKFFFFFVFVFVFATPINSLPHNALIEERAPKHKFGKFLQCPGDYPINFTQLTYTPEILVPRKNISKTEVWDSTVAIDTGVTNVLNVYFRNELVYTNKTDLCELIKSYGGSCPIPAGHFNKTFTYPFPSSPRDPKHKSVEYLVNNLSKLSNCCCCCCVYLCMNY